LMTYMMEDPRTIPKVLTALFCARSIECIGNCCQNICEFIFYFVEGKDLHYPWNSKISNIRRRRHTAHRPM
ncbi:MAG: phosphate transport system regulator PhoU, partial [Candidatus Regiella insecticola]|nr:phosphate transport system regulator PhoU [Candidatus Regiella insecticola]